MFEGDWTALDARATLVAVGECHETEHRAARGKLLAAVHFADLHHPDGLPGGADRPGGERGVVLGGPGCPPIREFVAAEFGAMIGVSAGSAAHFIGQALALRHKLPRTWAMVLDGEATPWKACKIATACLDLSEEAAAIVDRKVAGIVDTVGVDRLENIVKAAIRRADPEGAEAEAKRKARERGVHVGRSDEHGNKKIWVRAATGDVIRFDATIDSIAQALKLLGDTDTLQHRRATAIGIIADPDLTAALLTHARDLPPNPNPDARLGHHPSHSAWREPHACPGGRLRCRAWSGGCLRYRAWSGGCLRYRAWAGGCLGRRPHHRSRRDRQRWRRRWCWCS